MTAVGCCHGPGCTQPAKVEFWCSDVCSQAWHATLDNPPPAQARLICARCLRGDCPEPLADWEAELLAGVGARMACSLPSDQPVEGATKQQVAPENPQVGWLGQWINRLFGRQP